MNYKEMLAEYQAKLPAVKAKVEQLKEEKRCNCKMGRIPDSDYEMRIKKMEYDVKIEEAKAELALYKHQIKLLKEKIKESK